MQEQSTQPTIPARIARILLKTILFLLLFIVLVFLLVLTPPVQRFLTGKAENFLEKKLGTRVEIGSISFGLSGNVSLENIYIEDKTKDTLISGGTIKSHINLMKLFSNEIQIKDIELQNVTAKIKRVLPDTVFNFQFVVDAFMKDRAKDPDTATTAPMKFNISDASLENVRLHFIDAVTGNDIWARIGNLSTTIDSIDINVPYVDIGSIIVRNTDIKARQTKPLLTPEPLSKDMAEARQPTTMRIAFGTIDFNKVNLDYSNDVSALYTTLKVGQLKAKGKNLDLQSNSFHLEELGLANTTGVVRLGKTQTAKVIAKEAAQELTAQAAQGFRFLTDRVRLDNNTIRFDNDAAPRLKYGMDFAHLDARELNLHVDDFILSNDSTGGKIVKGSFREKTGFVLQELTGDLLYAKNQAYLKNLYIKTPGSEIQRSAVLEYASIDALLKNPAQTVLDIELVNSRLQVKDILAFVPQLRSNPALANPNAVWNINLIASGTLNRLFVESLRFSGMRDTRIDASGTLVNLMNPNAAGGNFTIRQLHTTQSDIALFTGQRLSTPQLLLPETFDISGTVNGNAGRLQTALDVRTSLGNIGLNGTLSNLMSPTKASYAANVRTSGLQLGTMLRQPGQIGSLTGNFTINGTGLTPEAMNARFKGNVSSVGFNRYTYRNLVFNGTYGGNRFSVNADANDPNADFNLAISGSLGGSPSFTINGMVDSVKTLALNFTTQPLIFRGKINGTVNNLNPDYLDADLSITNALLVTNEHRLPLDTLQFTSGRNGDQNFMRLQSDLANLNLEGRYRFSDLGTIIQSTIQPYFSVAPRQAVAVAPYDFSFRADVVYNPIYSAFVPGFTAMEPLHAEGSFSSANGMTLSTTTSYLAFAGTELNNLNVRANTSDSGLQINGVVGHLKSGSSFDVYNTRINATALNNVINFDLGIDDANARNKYSFGGTVNQPSAGTYAISIRPDNLLLNYEPWTMNAGNQIIISPNSITARDFVLQKDGQQLSIRSLDGLGTPLQVSFNDFRLSTITGFVKSDSVLADGVLNGNVTFENLTNQPVFTSDLTIRDLSLRKDTIGNVALKVSSQGGNRYNTNMTLTGRGNDIALNGYFAPTGKNIDLNLDLDVRALQLNTLEGAMATAITNASGAINGKVSVRGTTASPRIQGRLNFDTASFALTLLGSQFRINDEAISVTENGFFFDDFTIRDSADNRLNIDGSILTSNFINYNFDLGVDARNFMLLNSAKGPGKIYYGKLMVDSDIRIGGTELTPVIDGSLTVNEGTNLSVVVPQRDQGLVQREGVVEFVDMDAPMNDSLFLAYDSLNRSALRGFDIAANIEVKKEAILNVIIDEANGDFLNVQGEALLSAGVDPSGKITLVGNYTLESGAYQLSFNFLQRRFEIEKGSTITWTGEPTSALLNVTAIYVANTSPLDLVQDQLSAPTAAIRNTYLQKLPFEVHLTMTGELMKPVIAFDILLPEDRNYGVSNDIVTQVQGRLNQLRQDEGEINKQVFSLLLLGRFVGENPFQSSGGGFDAGSYARQSVSRLLTEQLNNLAGGLIQGVDLNFDVESADDYTTGERRNRTDLNVGLSKRLLNDRLKVTIGSNFQLEGPQNSNQRANNIAGNIALDYQLSRNGRYLIRFFRRNQYEGIVDGYIVENGLSFIISVDFNRISEIFMRNKKVEDLQRGNQTEKNK